MYPSNKYVAYERPNYQLIGFDHLAIPKTQKVGTLKYPY